MIRPESHTRLLLTVREAAAALAISARTLWAITKAGQIQHVKIGRSIRYAVADINAYIAACKLPQTNNDVV